jgi:hypothetical protein
MNNGKFKVQLQGAKLNGKADLEAVVTVFEGPTLVYEALTNLSKAKDRAALALRLSEQFAIDGAEALLLMLMQKAREELEASSSSQKGMSEYVPGFVLPDGTIGELVLEPDSGERAFVVRTSYGKIVRVPRWTGPGGIVFEPPKDKLVGQVVLFPSQVATYGNLATLLMDVKGFIHCYLEVPENYKTLAALYVVMTWVFDALPVVPYLRARGDFGTGKSRFLQVIGIICYRPIFASGATTPSPVFRILDRYPGTFILDEADFQHSNEWSEIVKILNQGYKPGTPVLRSEKRGEGRFEPEGFHVFGPKVIATRQKFKDEALESRCLTNIMTPRTRDDVPIILPQKFHSEALALRNKLLSFRLDYLPQIQGYEYGSQLMDKKLEDRVNEVIAPIKALAHGDKKMLELIANTAVSLQEELLSDRRESLEAKVIAGLFKLRAKGSDAELSAKAVAATIASDMDSTADSPTDKKVGWAFKRLNLKTGQGPKSRRSVVLWDQGRMEGLAKRYGLGSLLSEKSPLLSLKKNLRILRNLRHRYKILRRIRQEHLKNLHQNLRIWMGMILAMRRRIRRF